jgi:hypothetical protein
LLKLVDSYVYRDESPYFLSQKCVCLFSQINKDVSALDPYM